jgi:uncharacterized membrane protein
MTFANFVTIQYALLIDEVPVLNSIFSDLWLFAAVFVAAYIPISIIVGYWHRKSQLKIEQEAIFNENVMNARMWLFMLELVEGNASEEEKAQMRNMLKQIIKKNPVDKKKEISKILDEESRPVSQKPAHPEDR